MGVDCTAIIEFRNELRGEMEWEMVGFYCMPRWTEFYRKIEEKAFIGYPSDITYEAKHYLTEFEQYGECWMWLEDFIKLAKKKKYHFPDVYKDKLKKDMRIIFRFDH